MIYSEALTKYFKGGKVTFKELNGDERYIWRTVHFLEKYHLFPSDWDKSHPIGLLPKELRDLEAKEYLDSLVEEAELNKPTPEQKSKPVYVNYPNAPESKTETETELDERGFKPIKTKEDLAELMGTDSKNIEIIQEREKN